MHIAVVSLLQLYPTGKRGNHGLLEQILKKLVSALKIDENSLFAPSEEIIPQNELLRELLDIVAEFDFKGQMLFLAFAKEYQKYFKESP